MLVSMGALIPSVCWAQRVTLCEMPSSFCGYDFLQNMYNLIILLPLARCDANIRPYVTRCVDNICGTTRRIFR